MADAGKAVQSLTPGQKAAKDLEELTKKSVPTLAEEVEEYEEDQGDWQAMYNAGGKFKEQLEEIVQGSRGPEEQERGGLGKERKITGMETIPTMPEIEKKPEVAGYIEKGEKDMEVAAPVMDDYTQQVLMSPAAPQNPTVTLPLTDDQVQLGLHQQVWASIRWLAEWCVRQIKMLGGRVRYKNKVS